MSGKKRGPRILGQFAPRTIEMMASPAYRALSLSGHRVLSRAEIEFAAHGGEGAKSGNENGGHQADGVYYLGPGATEPYAVVNVGGRYAVTRWLTIVGQVNNLFDRRYTTAALLGSTAFNGTGVFVARPFPAPGGEVARTHSTVYAPGAPIRAWMGLRVRL